MAVLLTIGPAQREGSLSYNQWVVPAEGPATLVIRPNIQAADFTDPAHTLEFRVFVEIDGAWVYRGGGTWQGHPDANPNDPDQVPVFEVGLSGDRGRRTLGEMLIPNRMRVGLTVETI